MATEAFLLFSLQRQRYAIRLSAVDGVDSPQTICSVPGASRHVLGLAHWRGNLLTVFDLPGLVEDAADGGSGCLLRLAAPHEGLALFLPASTSIGHLQVPESSADSLERDGLSHRLLVADELVERACMVEA